MYWLYKNAARYFSNSYTIHVEEDKITINDMVFPLSVLAIRTDFRSFGKFIFPAAYSQKTLETAEDIFGGKHAKPFVRMPFELFAQTAQSKVNAYELSFIQRDAFEVAVTFYPETKNFKDALLTLIAPADENTPYQVTTTDSKGNIIEYIPDRIITEGHPSVVPPCDLQKVGFDGTATDLEFTYKNIRGIFIPCDFEAKVKTTCGFVSHTDLNVIGGKARFKWLPLGMPPGYQATIQVGIGKHTEVATITLDT